MSEAERIEYLIKVLEAGNYSAFAEKIGTTSPNLFKMRKGQIGIRLQIPKILKAYPQVNREWLETGEGYPGDLTIDLVKAHLEAKIRRHEMVIDQLITQLNEYRNNLQ